MDKLRIMSVFGTRPEAIKMCPLCAARVLLWLRIKAGLWRRSMTLAMVKV